MGSVLLRRRASSARRSVTLALAAVAATLATAAPAAASSGESAVRSVQAGAIAAGSSSSCGIRAGGHVSCWGNANDGQIGNGELAPEVPAGGMLVSNLDDATQVVVGYVHACALRADRTVWCWGRNYMGQIGDGTAPAYDNVAAVPRQVLGIHDATAITATMDGVCALHTTGHVSCWGDNTQGQLGQPLDAASPYVTTPREVPGLANVAAIDAGWYHACAVKTDHTLWCWGRDADGQIGQPRSLTEDATWYRPTPAAVPGVTDAVAVSAGVDSTCFVRTNGGVSCMGSDNVGEAGQGTVTGLSSEVPRPVVGLGGKVVDVSTGYWLACAVLESGTVQCWGNDNDGELGNDVARTSSPTPQTVHDLVASAVNVDRLAVCAISRTGTASCWGEDRWANLGNGSDLTDSATGPTGVLEFTTPYGLVATPALTTTAPATIAAGTTATARVSLHNDGPDDASFSVTVSVDGHATLGAPAGSDATRTGDYSLAWRTGPVAAGATAQLDVPITGAFAGAATLRAAVLDSSALDPRRPLGRGPLADGQRASATTTVTGSATPPSASGGPTPPAALDVKQLINLASTKCRKPATPVRIVLTAPAGARVKLATAKLSKGAPTTISGSVNGTLRLPKGISKAIDASPKAAVKVTINVTLTDGRVAERTLSVKRC